METLLISLLNGVIYGLLLFMVSAGLTLIFGMMGVLNLAHASFFMLSAYLGYQVVALTGSFWFALALAPLGSALVGVAMERFLLRRVHAFGHMGELILTVGVASIVTCWPIRVTVWVVGRVLVV